MSWKQQEFKEFLKDFDLIKIGENRCLAIRKNSPLCFAFYDYNEKNKMLVRTL